MRLQDDSPRWTEEPRVEIRRRFFLRPRDGRLVRAALRHDIHGSCDCPRGCVFSMRRFMSVVKVLQRCMSSVRTAAALVSSVSLISVSFSLVSFVGTVASSLSLPPAFGMVVAGAV